MTSALFQSDLPHLDLIYRGKVRDVYAIDDEHMLIVASDRLSAFDVIMAKPIPGKGEVLTRVANFWFGRTSHLVPNQLSDVPLEDIVPDQDQRNTLGERATVVKRFSPLPIEAVVRGYVIGSGWKDYQATGQICGIDLPKGLPQAAELEAPIFTPATKAEMGDHDENIGFEQMSNTVGKEMAEKVKSISLQIYQEAATYARQRGIIIADTKFEFGLDKNGELHLIDEVLTPDSSRFWPADTYQPGISPPSFDKQFLRDYLETLDWDKTPPPPELPEEIVEKTAAKYAEAETRLTKS
ncbi:MAG: phosphoribosylaminoimidazolesuccinocarboxamide synthase [Acidiferrobacterales bacterium]|nr:phosphoribosylaminoimidazolesuccinocarboxamide synthase [Acidiferrobacterales bacterium]